jgi:hypothetical protein
VEQEENKQEESKEEKPTTVQDVPSENADEDKDASAPKEEKTEKPVDMDPQTSDNSNELARFDGIDKKLDSVVDLLTSVLNKVSDGDSKEDDEPEKTNDNDNDDSVESFENLL